MLNISITSDIKTAQKIVKNSIDEQKVLLKVSIVREDM